MNQKMITYSYFKNTARLDKDRVGNQDDIQYKEREFWVTRVGLSMSCVAFTVAQKDSNASPLGLFERRSQFKSPVSTMSLLRDNASMYFGSSSFSRHAVPISGGL